MKQVLFSIPQIMRSSLLPLSKLSLLGLFLSSFLISSFTFAQDWVWTGEVDNNFSTAGNWLVDGSPTTEGPNAASRLSYEFNLAAGGTVNLDGGTNFAASSITFGSGAGAFTFQTADNTHFRNATGSSGTSAMSITQNSNSIHTFEVRFDGMHDGANFSGTGTGNLVFESELRMFNRTADLNVNTTTYRPIWEGAIYTNSANRRRNFGGSGTFEISGASTGTNTNVSTKSGTGTLLITNQSGYALGNVPLVANSGTLAGTGAVTEALLTVGSGMILSPGMHGDTVAAGNEIGTLTSNDMLLNEGFIYNWDFNATDSDRFVLNGELDLGDSNSALSIINLVGDMGDFNPLSNNVLFTFDSIVGASNGQVLSWQINHNDVDSGYFAVVSGNDVLVAIPEPSTYAAIFAGLALGVVLLRRRLRK